MLGNIFAIAWSEVDRTSSSVIRILSRFPSISANGKTASKSSRRSNSGDEFSLRVRTIPGKHDENFLSRG